MKIYLLKDIYYTQAKNCYFCIQIGTIVIYFCPNNHLDWKPGQTSKRLELFTPKHLFRWG